MKKLLFLSIAILSVEFTNAQMVTYGVKAGLNIANLSYSEDIFGYENPQSLYGFHVGVLGVSKIKENFSFQLELLYSQQGAKFESSSSLLGVNTNFKRNITLNYINVPAMFKYYLIPELSVEAGPQVGFLLNGKDETTTSVSILGVTTTGNTSDDVTKEYMKSVDFGFNVGAGFYFAQHFSINFRYNVGISNLYDRSDRGDYSIKNNVFSTSLGYKF